MVIWSVDLMETAAPPESRLIHHQVWPNALPLYEPGVSYGGSSVPRCIENARALTDRIAAE